MVSEQRLEEQCPPKTFQRARLIAASGQILTKRCRFDQTGTHLRRSWRQAVDGTTVIELDHADEDDSSIKDYACTCPAALQHDAPCKHLWR
ncbi:MAG: hypothetical protein ACLTQI_03705 [Slackia sp.]